MPDIMQGRCRVYCPELERMVLLSLSRPGDPSWYEARAVATWNELRDHIGETSHLHRELGEFGAVSFPDGDPCYFPGVAAFAMGRKRLSKDLWQGVLDAGVNQGIGSNAPRRTCSST